jgi:FkbM family methyltransferase
MSASIPPVRPGGVTASYLTKLLGAEARTILEIGANDGSHTVHFLRMFPRASIFAFEPDPRAIAKFKKNAADPRVRLFEMAIGATDGTAEFHRSSGFPDDAAPEAKAQDPEGWDQSGSLRAPKSHKVVWPWVKFDSTLTVPVQRLDSWAGAHGIDRVDLIWADVQGAEDDLIAGGGATLARTRFLFTEYSDDEWYEGQPTLARILDLLPAFRILRRYQTDVLLENTAFAAT